MYDLMLDQIINEDIYEAYKEYPLDKCTCGATPNYRYKITSRRKRSVLYSACCKACGKKTHAYVLTASVQREWNNMCRGRS